MNTSWEFSFCWTCSFRCSSGNWQICRNLKQYINVWIERFVACCKCKWTLVSWVVLATEIAIRQVASYAQLTYDRAGFTYKSLRNHIQKCVFSCTLCTLYVYATAISRCIVICPTEACASSSMRHKFSPVQNRFFTHQKRSPNVLRAKRAGCKTSRGRNVHKSVILT